MLDTVIDCILFKIRKLPFLVSRNAYCFVRNETKSRVFSILRTGRNSDKMAICFVWKPYTYRSFKNQETSLKKRI
jgi:hypothetical protein